jgi:hypothetical protein
MKLYTQQLAGLSLLLLATFVGADERVLVLEDGSQIRGELISYEQGTYTVRTTSLGIVKLSDDQVQQVMSVKALALKAAPTPSALGATVEKIGNSVENASIEALKSAIMSSTSLMSSITSLQSDPQVQALLADPEILRAVQTLDFETLSRSPKVQALMQNPKVKALQAEIGVGQ